MNDQLFLLLMSYYYIQLTIATTDSHSLQERLFTIYHIYPASNLLFKNFTICILKCQLLPLTGHEFRSSLYCIDYDHYPCFIRVAPSCALLYYYFLKHSLSLHQPGTFTCRRLLPAYFHGQVWCYGVDPCRIPRRSHGAPKTHPDSLSATLYAFHSVALPYPASDSALFWPISK